jgi:hypothetical protein
VSLQEEQFCGLFPEVDVLTFAPDSSTQVLIPFGQSDSLF